MTTLAQEASHPSAKDGWVAACETGWTAEAKAPGSPR